MLQKIYFYYIIKLHKSRKIKRINNINLLYEHYKNKDKKIPTCYEKILIGNCFYCFRYAVEILQGQLPDKLHDFMLLKYLEFKTWKYGEKCTNVMAKEFFWTNEYFGFLIRPQDYSKVYLRYIFNKISHNEYGSNVFEYMASGMHMRDFISFNLSRVGKRLSYLDGLIYWLRRNLKWLLKSTKI